MNKRQRIFKCMWIKNGEDVLALIYQSGGISFADICKNFPKLSSHTIRNITNNLSSAGLIKSKKDNSSDDKRSRIFVVKDESLVITLLEL